VGLDIDRTDLSPSTLDGWSIIQVTPEPDGTFWLLLHRAGVEQDRLVHLYGFREQGVRRVAIEEPD